MFKLMFFSGCLLLIVNCRPADWNPSWEDYIEDLKPTLRNGRMDDSVADSTQVKQYGNVNQQVILRPGEYIMPPAEYVSPSGRYGFKVTEDTMLVYQKCNDYPVFRAFNHNASVEKLSLYPDGNLILHGYAPRRHDTVLWESTKPLPTKDGPPYRLTLSNDGFLHMCNDKHCYWQSSGLLDRACRNDTETDSNQPDHEIASSTNAVLDHSEHHSNNGQFRMEFQGDGNLVVYRNCDNRATFSSHTAPSSSVEAKILTDGRFVLQGSFMAMADRIYMAAPGTNSSDIFKPYRDRELRLGDDGFLYLCKNDFCTWRSGFYRPPECL